MEIARFYVDFNKYTFSIYPAKFKCDLCLENKANLIFKKDNNMYYICKTCSKAKIIAIFHYLTNGKFSSIRVLTNRHYIIVKRIKNNGFCNCKNNVEFEFNKYKVNSNYICQDCLKEKLIEIKNYLLTVISVKK